MIVVVAKLKALAGKEEELAAVCLGLAKEVRENEKECLMYDPHISVKNPGEIVFLEKYASPEAQSLHRQTPYFKEASKQIGKLEGPPEVSILKALG